MGSGVEATAMAEISLDGDPTPRRRRTAALSRHSFVTMGLLRVEIFQGRSPCIAPLQKRLSSQRTL